jgi:hypothetical protein
MASKPSANSAPSRRKRLAEAMRLQEIENNPLDAEDVALFEMFEREGWSQERRLEYLRQWAHRAGATPNAAE